MYIGENFTLTVEFGCLESDDIDQILCIVDKSGDHWWLDGDYQLQVGIKKTGHSVWVKSGYLLVIDIDHYLFCM